MAITPHTNLRLLKVPLTLDNKNQLTFKDKANQFEYFSNLPSLLVDNISYQRKDSTIRFPGHIDSLLGYNYVMYQNDNYTDKYFYCFITNMKYINDGMTEITIKTDVFQTWQFDLNYKKMMIEREHVENDTIGLHTVPEGLEHGEYVNNTPIQKIVFNSNYICFALTEYPAEVGVLPRGTTKYNGIYSGLIFAVVETAEEAMTVINQLAIDGKSDSIYAIFMVPDFFVNAGVDFYTSWIPGVKFGILRPSDSSYDIADGYKYTKPSSLNGYTPKNNKLLTYPYQYLNVSNNCGNNAIYNFEDFKGQSSEYDTEFVLFVSGAIGPGCSLKLQPLQYKNISGNYEEGLNSGKLPICSWTTDVYVNWLTQNGINIGNNMLNGITGTLISGLAGSPTGVYQSISNLVGTYAEIYQHSLIPSQANGNLNAGDINFATNNTGFNLYFMSIKKEYAQIIDEFFSKYGYKVNEFKIPNLNSRKNFNFIKTIDSNIIADIPQQDLQEIKNMFDSGITLWHNSNTFLDYTQDNSIVI